MIKSAITVSLVEEAQGGPFVFWDGLPAACQRASELGYDAIEIFAPAADAVDRTELQSLLQKFGLKVAAVGTGAGMVKHGLSLTDIDSQRRGAAIAFVKGMIDFGAAFDAPAIIGSMQGRWGGDLDRGGALELLRVGLDELGEYATQFGVPLIYEPLNRYETNLINTLSDGVAFLKTLSTDNVKLLADLFHMNIEEIDLADAIRQAASFLGHIHFVDSNRQAAGSGHLDFAPIATALLEIDFNGYASAEICPIPDSQTAATKTIAAFKQYFRN